MAAHATRTATDATDATDATAAPLARQPPPRELPARARRALAADDLDGFRRLFERSPAIEDPHLRYWAGLGLVDEGLAAVAHTTAARLPALLVTLADGALELLEREPSEPRLLNQTAGVLYELWSVDAAQVMFEAAARLDPQLQGVPESLRRVAARRETMGGSRGGAPLRGALPALARRALEVASRAQPARGLRLSLCMIVRDEEQMLPRCLAAVAPAVDEIVIVDTGSGDATIDIARAFGARVFERPWTGSFAEARNVSFDAAQGDWLMYLDADEVLVAEDAGALRELTGRTWREAFYLDETSHTGALDEGTAVAHNALRVFRNRPEYRFEGRLHEQMAHRLPAYLPERFEATNVRVEHFGYLGAVRDAREKSRRNIELLRRQQAESPPTPFLHYNLGCEHAAAGDNRAALAELERAWEMLERSPERDGYAFAPALLSRLVKALRLCGRPRDAFARSRDGLELFPDFTDLVLEQARAAIALGEEERAIELCERCIELGDAPPRYTATVGCGTYLPRVCLAELRRARGDTAAAIELLGECLREHPRFVGSVLPFADALIEHGVEPDAVAGRLEGHLANPSPAARFMLGTALYEAGAAGAGEAQFRLVLTRQPRSGRARVALGEALLAQRRYAEAAREAAQLPAEDPLAPLAARTELFARLAGLETGAVADALARARTAGMAPAELELFAAWEQLAGRGQTAASVAEEAVPLLAVMLEALLRVHDFDAFETLLDLLERAPLPERERRELLAEMYLRRGFATAAAEEWMRVCRRQPDVRALLGLARVAELRGMRREANDFATAALARDPDNQAAASMLVHAAAA